MGGEALTEVTTIAGGRGMMMVANEGVPATRRRVAVRVMVVIAVREIGAIEAAPETIGTCLGGAPHAAGPAIAAIKAVTAMGAAAAEIATERTRLEVPLVAVVPAATTILAKIADDEATRMRTAVAAAAAICTMTATAMFQ